MKIGIYGGTFNPIHTGHMAAAKFAAEYLGLEKLYLIPAGIPPHKRMAVGSPGPEHRLAMAKLAAEAIGPEAEALDLELRREGRSYTADTLRQLRERHPEDHLYLLMGTDMFLTLQQWWEPEEIVRLCTLCAFGRSEKDVEELFAVQRRHLAEAFGADVVTLVLPHVVDISSTELRELLKRGEGRAYLDPAVYGYILRNGLYGVEADLKKLPLADLRCAAMSMLKRSRVPHVLGVEGTAAALARRWGAPEEDARRAALLHDCTKRLDREQQLELCRQYKIEPDEMERREPNLLHAITGAAVARDLFGVSREIADAIRWHTTAKADMTLLEKILYLADYIEPTRDFCDLAELRKRAFEDLDGALLLGLTMAVEDLGKKDGVAVHPNSVYARDYLKGKLT